MKLPRRWAAGFAAFLMAVSLVAAPQPGRAKFIDGLVDPPPREGDPDTPGGNMPQSAPAIRLPLLGRYVFIFVGRGILVVHVPDSATRPADHDRKTPSR